MSLLVVVVVLTVSVAKVRLVVLRLILLPPLMKAEEGRRRVWGLLGGKNSNLSGEEMKIDVSSKLAIFLGFVRLW